MRPDQLAELIHETHQSLMPQVVQDWERQSWESVDSDVRMLLTGTAQHVKAMLEMTYAQELTETLMRIRADPTAWHELETIFNARDTEVLAQFIYDCLRGAR